MKQPQNIRLQKETNARLWRTQTGFSLLELLVATGIFSIAAAALFQALQLANRNAMLSRLQTGASTVAQNRTDLLLSDGPFNPQKNQIPPALQPGVQTIGSESNPTQSIYVDPATGTAVVQGWMTSTVTNLDTSLNGQNLNLFRAEVAVFYRFQGRMYSVSMSTLRSPDI